MGLRSLVQRVMLGKQIQDGREGLATVVTRSQPPVPTPTYIGGARLNLIVQVGKGTPFKVSLTCSAPGDKYPRARPGRAGAVARDDPQRVQVDWEKMLTPEEQFERM